MSNILSQYLFDTIDDANLFITKLLNDALIRSSIINLKTNLSVSSIYIDVTVTIEAANYTDATVLSKIQDIYLDLTSGISLITTS